MNNRVSAAVAATLKRGDILYHNIIEFGTEEGNKTPATAVVTGAYRALPDSVEEFCLPIRKQYCQKTRGAVSKMSQDLWRTTPEPVVTTPRVSRVRTAHTPEPAAEEPTPARRVRRVRPGR